jgi:biotin carboxyl carrier protein
VKKGKRNKKKMGNAGQSKKIEVRAPMSGIFYRKPAPDQPPYVEVGDTVKKKQIIALLETMKVFQKVKSPASGKILEIAVENETALKDDDLMFVIQTG